MTRALNDDDHTRIRELAEKGWKSGRIAQVIGKKPATVYWFMLRNGLAERPVSHRTMAYKRGANWVYPYSAEEDAFIEALRIQNYDFKTIADLATKRFGKPRNHHSVFVRLTILAATEKAAA
jgi:IS30 family transposase